jgi:hypothetical protein
MSDNEVRDMSLDSALRKVRGLIAKAEDLNNPESVSYNPAEAEACSKMADVLMFKYALKDAMADQAKPAEERTKPCKIEVEIGGWDSDIIGYIARLSMDIADHCRCKIRPYGYYDYVANAWQAKVYGFQSDVKYFEFLYTTLRLHMLGVLIPKFESNLTMEENCYRLHNAGYNWLEMAAMQGWKKYPRQDKNTPGHLVRYYNQKTDEELPAGKVGGMYKRPYYRACELKGESPVKIPAGTTDNYRKDAANGYTDQLRARLRMMREAREGQSKGTEVVLLSRFEDIEAMYREDNPELFVAPSEGSGKTVKVRMGRIKQRRFSEAGYSTGVAHANTAELGTGVGNTRKGEIS